MLDESPVTIVDTIPITFAENSGCDIKSDDKNVICSNVAECDRKEGGEDSGIGSSCSSSNKSATPQVFFVIYFPV